MTTFAVLTSELRANTALHDKNMVRSSNVARTYGQEAKKARQGNRGLSNSFSLVANSASGLSNPLDQLSAKSASVSQGFKSMGARGNIVVGVLAAMAAASGKTLSEFSKQERSQLKLTALLKATGGASGLTAGQLDKMARSVARNTLANTEGVKSAQAVLLTFKTVQGDAFESAIKLSQDLVAVMGGDIKSAAKQLGKALEDPTTGLSALKEAGVSFSASERELIKSLQETGKAAEAQRLILEKLEGQVGGAAKAEGAGLAGAVDLLSQEFDELFEELGKFTSAGEYVKTGLDYVAGGLRSVRESFFPDEIQQYNNLLEDRAELEAELQDIRANGTGFARLITGNTEANLEAEKYQIEEQISALKQKQEAKKQEVELAKESARLSRENAEKERKEIENDEKKNELLKEQLKLQQQLVREAESRAKGKDSLYNKLFGGEKDNRRVLDNSAFNNYAKAAKTASQDGRTDDFKRLIKQAESQLDSSKRSSFRYDLEGMQDVITLLKKQAGEKPDKIGTLEIKVGEKESVDVQGNTRDLTQLTKDLASILSNEAASVAVA